MLRKIIIILFITYGNSISAQKSGYAYYKKSSIVNYGKTLGKSQVQSTISSNSVNEAISNMSFVLKFNDSVAIYEEERKLPSSSINEYAKVFSGFKGPYFFKLNTGEVLRKSGKFLISKKHTDFQWNISNEKTIINELTCYKATTKLHLKGRRGEIIRPVVAWFTNDINLLVGPDGFFGLPGLIIQIEINNVVTTLTKIDFTNEMSSIEPPKFSKIMTEKEFENYTKDLVENREKYYGND